MKQLLRISLLLSFLFTLTTSQAQKKRPQDYNWFGAEIGLTSSTFRADSIYFPSTYPLLDAGANFVDHGATPDYTFTPGYGLMIGGVVDFTFSSRFGAQGKLQYRTHSASGTGTSTIPCQLSDGTTIIVPTSQKADATLSMLGLSALLRVQIQEDQLYGLVGLDFSELLSNSTKTSLTLEDSQCTWRSLPSGVLTTEKTLSNSSSLTDFYNSERLGLQLGIGDWFMLDNGWAITPEFMLSIPLTSLLKSNNIQNGNRSGDPSQDVSVPINGDKGGLYWASFSFSIKFPWGQKAGTMAMDGSSSSSVSSTGQQQAKIRGHVTDKSTGKPIDANLTVVDLGSNEIVQTGKTDRDGDYEFTVKAPGKYSVTADANGYLFGSAYFEIDENGRILREDPNIEMSPATGRTRLLVFFDFDKSNLQPSSYPALNRAADLMKSNPNMQVEIAGYTDSKGTHMYNMDLSQHRAASVRDYLIARGIDPKRIASKGYAEADPTASNDTDEGRAQNRRVEFVVMRK